MTTDEKLDLILQRVGNIDQRLDHIDQRLDHVGQRLDHVGQRLDHVEQRLDHVEQQGLGNKVLLDRAVDKVQKLSGDVQGIDRRLMRIEGHIVNINNTLGEHTAWLAYIKQHIGLDDAMN